MLNLPKKNILIFLFFIDKLTNNIPQRLKIVCNESEILRFDTSSIIPTDIIQDTNGKHIESFS